MNPTKLLHIDPDIVNTGLDSVVVIYSVLAVAFFFLLVVFLYTRKVYKEWKELKDAGKMDWLKPDEVYNTVTHFYSMLQSNWKLNWILFYKQNQDWFERWFLWLMQLRQN